VYGRFGLRSVSVCAGTRGSRRRCRSRDRGSKEVIEEKRGLTVTRRTPMSDSDSVTACELRKHDNLSGCMWVYA
jgi:hypothetical protein